jgi:hypothetical protein
MSTSNRILNARSYTRWTWLVLALLVAAAFYLGTVGRWLGVIVLGGTVALSLTFIAFESWLPRLFNLLFALAGTLNAIAYVFDLWHRISIYDEFVHAYTTFAITGAFGYLLLRWTKLDEKGRIWQIVLTIMAFGLVVGILWEVFEWIIGIIGDAVDTIIDLAMDSLGALVAAAFCAWATKRESDATSSGGSRATKMNPP